MKHLALLIVIVLAGVAKPVLSRPPLAASAFAESCLHAPAPRLRVGGEAVVAAGVDRLNMRALPALDTGVSVQLFSGNTLSVLDGPSCNGLYTWWRVESANGSRGWVAEGTWERYFVVPLEDAADPPTPFEGSCLLPFDPLFCG